MDDASQDRGENGQDEEAEGTSENVKDETVFCALAAFLERHGCKFKKKQHTIKQSPTMLKSAHLSAYLIISVQTLMRALTTSISSSFILLITT